MTTDRSLRELAAERGLTVGAMIGPDSLRTESDHRRVLATEFDAVTPGSPLKMGPLRPSPDTYDFGDADTIVDFALANDMSVRGHTLVWHQQQPEWFETWNHSDERVREFLRDHIYTVAGRYRKKIDTWDVVNEAVADDDSLRETMWYDAMGEDYIANAFRWADEVTHADLYYNDYGGEAVNEKSDAIYDLLADLLERDVPIDGVGLQLHALFDRPDPESIAENIERFQDLGLDVEITEMDVDFYEHDAPDDPLELQADYYREITEVCLETGCDGMTVAGVNDATSWLRYYENFPELFIGDPLLFDDWYEPKPAYEAVVETLDSY
ncbi:endo-1,4-beta-xylanase [Natrinema zhouii]|uniref:endo-1,4-beta-xylanase n=1 Tax=Natrinema zhouii TaxID=1710539 RepID=A0A7D6CP84_9EURY|nr:endo-1,4-beta-xylanase [Natrinema zhouii]QLK26652.1 endo-1,4-beta-xylanase [Natrinema zhouii]